MAEIDLFFGINNSDDKERIHSSSLSNRKQQSSVIQSGPREPVNAFPMDEMFGRPMSQVMQPSHVQNKPNRTVPRKYKVPYVNDTSFDDLSVDSLKNFSLSQALFPSQKRYTDNIQTHRNAIKRKSRSDDNETFIHLTSKQSVSPTVTLDQFNASQATTYVNIGDLTDATTPSHITISENKPNKKSYEHVQRHFFNGSENKEKDITLNENYSDSFSSPKEERHKSQNSILYDSMFKGVTDSLFTPAPLCFTGQKNVQHKLRSVDEIPVKFREVFEFPYFNMVQSIVFDEVFYTDKPVVVAAPTGAGKTVIFELAIIRLLTRLQDSISNLKIVYMAPMKALCTEKYLEWKSKFSAHSLNLMELTGDTELENFSELQQVNFILTTPEKWDSMSRKWKDNRSLFQMIGLFLIDEIHILNDSNRGATVEAVISRMKTLQLADRSTDRPNMRFIAVSATMPNIEDIAKWLGSNVRPAVHYKLDEKYRPVHLQKVVIGYPFKEGFSEFRFDMNLGYKIKGIIDAYSNNKPTLVFCPSRKSVQYTGETLKKEHYGRSLLKTQHREHVQKISRSLNDSKVSELVYMGIGIHHAGMEVHDRNLVEKLFREGELPVLIATSTLAMGVNLPAHLVVVKSTMFYNMGVPTEYSDTQVLQMIGRAGRPQFDKSATAVIMTKYSTKSKYESLLNGTQLIESSLHKNLIEHLNAEVVLHTITDMALAVEWIRHTFLYVRVMKNPRHYGYPTGLDWKQMEKRLEDLCLRNLNLLAELNLVNLHEETFEIVPTDTGKLMARYCIAFETMKNFHQVKTDASMKDMIDIIVGCREFEDITLRNNEKSVLNTLNKDKHKENIKFQMKGKIKTRQMKVNCLIQAQLGCLPIQDFSLSQDANKIFRIGQRVTKCLMEFLWQRNYHTSLLTAIKLFKCIKTKLWDDSRYVTKQLDGIGPTMSLALVNAGLTSFHTLEDANPREIELIVNRHPPFGNQIRDAVAALPKYEMSIEQLKHYKPQSSEMVISINLVNKETIMDHRGGKIDHQSVLLIGDQDNLVVFKWRIIDASILRDNGWRRRIEVNKAKGGPDLDVHLLSVAYVGLDIHTNYTPIYTGSFSRESNHEAVIDRCSTSKAVNRTLTGLPKDRICNHKCLNKTVCAHKCCKQGVSSSMKNKQSNCTDTSKDKRGVEAQISLLKNKMLQLTDDLPALKRQKVKDSRIAPSTIDLNQFAYHKPSPLEPRTKDLEPEPTSSLSDEQESSKYTRLGNNGGWTQLDMYQKERESLIQNDDLDIEILCTPDISGKDLEDMMQHNDFDEKEKKSTNQNTHHHWSSSPFSDEELCLAEEMAQNSQQNNNLNITPTNPLQDQTYYRQSEVCPEKQLYLNKNCHRMSGIQHGFSSLRPTNQKHVMQQRYNQQASSHPEPKHLQHFQNIVGSNQCYAPRLETTKSVSAMSYQPHYVSQLQTTESVSAMSYQPHYAHQLQTTESVSAMSYQPHYAPQHQTTESVSAMSYQPHYAPKLQTTESVSPMSYQPHYAPQLQTTESVSAMSYQPHYTPRHLPRSIHESPYLHRDQTSVFQNHLVSQTIPIFDTDENQCNVDFEKSVNGKPKAVEGKSTKFESCKKFSNYNDSYLFDDVDETCSDKENKNCWTIYDKTNRNASKEIMHQSMHNPSEYNTSNMVKSQKDVSPRHTYGQVLAWLTDEPTSVNLDHSQLLPKQCKTPLLMTARSPFQRHSKSPHKETCETVLNEKKDNRTYEDDTMNSTLASNKTSSFFQPYRSDSIGEVPDVGSNLFAGIF